MSQLRTVNAKRAVLRVETTTPDTPRAAKQVLVQSGISQSLPPKEIVRRLRARRLVIRN